MCVFFKTQTFIENGTNGPVKLIYRAVYWDIFLHYNVRLTGTFWYTVNTMQSTGDIYIITCGLPKYVFIQYSLYFIAGGLHVFDNLGLFD